MSDNNFMNDTSDMISSDFQKNENLPNHEGSVKLNESEPDPYFKIKLHSILALKNLITSCSKVVYNYWYILFPTFMMRP
jgi:hypothetical protein